MVCPRNRHGPFDHLPDPLVVPVRNQISDAFAHPSTNVLIGEGFDHPRIVGAHVDDDFGDLDHLPSSNIPTGSSNDSRNLCLTYSVLSSNASLRESFGEIADLKHIAG